MSNTMYSLQYSGQEVDEAIAKSKQIELNTSGFVILSSTESSPIDLNTLRSPGNYTMDYFINGPSQANGLIPLNVSVVNFTDTGELGQYLQVMNAILSRTTTGGDVSGTWGSWDSTIGEDHIYYGSTAPASGLYVKMIWYDTSTSSFKIYDGTSWNEVKSTEYMIPSIYDPTNKQVDIYQYLANLLKDYFARPNYETWTTAAINAFSTTITASSKIIGFSSFFNQTDTYLYANTNTPNKLFKVKVAATAQDWQSQIGSMTNPIVYSVAYDEDNYRVLMICAESTTPNAISVIKFSELPSSTTAFTSIIDNSSINLTFDSGVNAVIQKNLDSTKSSANVKLVLLIPCHDSNGYGVYACSCTLGAGNEIVSISANQYVKVGTAEFKYVCIKNVFYAIPAGTVSSNQLYQSTNGITWTAITLPRSDHWIDMAYGNGKYILISDNATLISGKHPFLMSTDGVTWSEVLISTSDATISTKLTFVKYTNEDFYFGSYSGSFFAMSYTDAVIKVVYSADTTRICDGVAFSNSNFYVLSHTSGGDGTTYSVLYAVFTDFKQKIVDHINNLDIHVTKAFKDEMSAKPTTDTLNTDINNLKTEVYTYANNHITDIQTASSTLNTNVTAAESQLSTHAQDTVAHTNQTEKDTWNSKAAGDHTHNLDGRVKITAADVVSGVFNLAQIPSAAQERTVKVTSETARLALTITNVQNGDTVWVSAEDGTNSFYFVIDDTKLGTEAAFQTYMVGTLHSIPFSNITGLPTTIQGYGITDAYTKTETNTQISTALTSAESYTDTSIETFATLASEILTLSE